MSSDGSDDGARGVARQLSGANQPQMTLAQKVSIIRRELGLTDDGALAASITQANEELGLAPTGSLPQQATKILDELGVDTASAQPVASKPLGEQPAEHAAESGSVDEAKAARKAARKATKAQRRAKREGDPSMAAHGQKACDLCGTRVDLLVRCQVSAGKDWTMVCGRCWKTPAVAGGVVDGDGSNPNYRYGGLWKNLHKPVG